jgi:molecular chaperone GrpE
VTGAAAQDREPDGPHEPDEPKESQEQRQLAELEDRWRRCMADLDNLRKRYSRELDREREAERARATAAWLPVLDNLELALEHGADHPDSLLDGVKAVRDQAVAVVELQGYPRDDEVGVPFEPARHDVVEVREEPELPSGVVVRVLRPGYGSATRQLRPAAVAVNKAG